MDISVILAENTIGDQIIIPEINIDYATHLVESGYNLVISQEWESGTYSYGLQVCRIENGAIEDIRHPNNTGSQCCYANVKKESDMLTIPGLFEINHSNKYKAVVAWAIPEKLTPYFFNEIYGDDHKSFIVCPLGTKKVFEKHFLNISKIIEADIFVDVSFWTDVVPTLENVQLY